MGQIAQFVEQRGAQGRMSSRMGAGTQIVQSAPQQAAQAQPTGDLGLDAQIRYAELMSKAGIVPDVYKGKPADILVAMGFGQSMGLSPAESLYRIAVIKGKPTMSAELIAAQVRKAGHRLRITKDERAVSATCTIVRCDDPDYPFTVTRDRKWAHQMGLDSKENYQKQPMTMLTWRAITACAREACPEALFGVAYTPDEMGDLDREPQAVPAQQVRVSAAVESEPTRQQAHARGALSPDEAEALRALSEWVAQQTGEDAAGCKARMVAACGNPLDDADFGAYYARAQAWAEDEAAMYAQDAPSGAYEEGAGDGEQR